MAKRKRKIQDSDGLYNFLRNYVDFMIRHSYKEIKYIGLEKIPTDGAVIIAPNHTNALMDALVVLCRQSTPTVFVARADLFKIPILKKIFTFLKIMPIMRIRDGVSEVKKNDETIQKSIDVLLDKVPFCILPEGTHRAMHSLLPLGKGIFRIALQTQELLPNGTPLYIVPFGIEYGNFFRFRSTVLAQVGDPINVKEFLEARPDTPVPVMMNEMKDILSQRMKEKIVYIPDDEHYDATVELCAVMNNQYAKGYAKEHPSEKRRSLTTRYACNKQIAKDIAELRESEPQKAQELLSLAQKFHDKREKAKISLSSTVVHKPLYSNLLKNIIFLITLPYTIPAGLVTLPLTGVIGFLLSKFKDRAFYNSVRFVCLLVIWPLLLIIYAVLAFCLLPWEWALAAWLLSIPAPIISQDAYRLLRIMVSDIKFTYNGKLRRLLKELRKTYNQCIK
ncbi:MAG: 1-acyl-sn-glycerol-3-phosphate acyltransferase [Bacteroidales bacterium]|nr:1-acyl-sn-glycerol-3-phosphate acyltransferase [Bacteroidales bacterium]